MKGDRVIVLAGCYAGRAGTVTVDAGSTGAVVVALDGRAQAAFGPSELRVTDAALRVLAGSPSHRAQGSSGKTLYASGRVR